jgi:lysophospholipase L1-like esterase
MFSCYLSGLMPRLKCALSAAALALLAGCGGGPSAPTPPTVRTQPVAVIVFYDENGNGVRDVQENVRIPNALVSIGTGSARTDAVGRAAVAAAPEGAQTVTVSGDTLPPYYTVAPLPIQVPAGGDVLLPARFPIGPRVIPNKYMAFGDSISFGTYEVELEQRLRGHFGNGTVVDEGVSGTRSQAGSNRIADSLDYAKPAATLILYGTNDWNEQSCKDDRFPCYTIDSLRSMIREVRFVGGVAFLGTIPPVNVGFNEQSPPERQEWVARMDDLIRKLARDEGVVLVDIQKMFLAQPSLRTLYDDHIHPNKQGQSLIAQEFFKAITQRQAAAASAWTAPAFGFDEPGR